MPHRGLPRLYPRDWRKRHGEEISLLLEEHPVTLATWLDLVIGALDAHVNHRVTAERMVPVAEPRQSDIRSLLVTQTGGWFVANAFIYPSARAQPDVFWSYLRSGALIVLGSTWVALTPPRRQASRVAVSPFALHFSS